MPKVWVTCISVKAPLMLKDTPLERFWSNICHIPGGIFCRNVHAYFSKAMPSHILHVTTAWLLNKRVQVLDRPACSPDLSPIENVWGIM